MSLASPSNYFIRPEDKALEALFPSMDDPLTSSFDQYVNGDLFDESDSDKGYGFLGDIVDLSDKHNGRFSPVNAPVKRDSSPQPWRKGLWCLHQNEATSPRLQVEKQRSKTLRVKQVQSPSTLIPHVAALHSDLPKSYTVSGLPSPRSPARHSTCHAPQKTKNLNSSPRTVRYRHNPYGRQTLSRNTSPSPSPMRPMHHHQSDMYQDTWQQDFKNFSLQAPGDALPLSPPLSGRPLQEFQSAHAVLSHAQIMQNSAILSNGMNIMGAVHDRHHYNTIASPPYSQYANAAATHSNENVNLSNYGHSQQVPSWAKEAFQTPSDEEYNYDFGGDMTTPSQAQQPWWTSPPNSGSHFGSHQDHFGSHQDHFGSHQDQYHQVIAAPAPQRPTHPIVQSTGFENGGLMIHYPDAQPHSMSTVEHVIQEPSYTNPNISSSAPNFPQIPPPQQTHSSQHLEDPHLHQPSHHLPIRHPSFTQYDPFSTPSHPQFPRSPSRSPSVSPTNTNTGYGSLRSGRLRSLSPQKSMENLRSNPRNNSIRTVTTPHPAGISKQPRTPKTPRTPTSTNNAFSVDFVNFTPRDSAKLLNDVAPSGSSKTRARREQEARERRRRLSEAAVKAVRNAGGDLGDLEGVLC